MTKLSKFNSPSREQQQAENIRKMFLAMAEDIRVVLIKLADRLHNMRTLSALPPEKQLRIARQTMEIYAPLAERLGIWQIKWELEDLAFKVVEPERFRELAKLLDTRRKGREGYIERAIAELSPRLEAAGIKADLQGRPKHIYSIFKKMQRKGAEFGEIYDVYAIRLLVDEVRDCYAALGVVHALWPPDPGAVRRLHRGSQEQPLSEPPHGGHRARRQAARDPDPDPPDAPGERGRDRRSLALQGGLARPTAPMTPSSPGCASSWTGSATSATPQSSSRASSSTSSRTRSSSSPRRATSRTCRLARRRSTSPIGSTPTSATGRSGPRSTTASCPLDYRLKNGDIVEIVTTRAEHGPSRDWLNIVRTSHAREKIRQWFKRKDRDENIVHGRESLERELRRLGRTTIAAVGVDRIGEVGRHYNFDALDDFYAAIGYGAISPQQVVTRLGVLDDAQLALPPTAPPPQPVRTGGVRVKGVGDLLTRFAKCCTPIPGDPIVGFITRGKGITVHLRTCPTVVNEREVSRLIEVEWEAEPIPDLPDRRPGRGL